MYRPAPGKTVEILRILHDSMDLQQHIPVAPDESGK
jgi:toxin ParE1/3/4